jgi:AcrR family transcriptional regulator
MGEVIRQVDHGTRVAETVKADQLRRLLAAVPDAIDRDGGYERTPVESMIKRAGISRRTFYDNFASRADVFRFAYDEAFDRYFDRVERAMSAVDPWPARVAAAVKLTVGLVAREPVRARLVLVDSLGVSLDLAHHHRRSLDRLIPLLCVGRRQPAAPAAMPKTLEQALIGGASTLLAARLESGTEPSLPGLELELLEFILAPYLGPDSARQVSAAQARVVRHRR